MMAIYNQLLVLVKITKNPIIKILNYSNYYHNQFKKMKIVNLLHLIWELKTIVFRMIVILGEWKPKKIILKDSQIEMYQDKNNI